MTEAIEGTQLSFTGLETQEERQLRFQNMGKIGEQMAEMLVPMARDGECLNLEHLASLEGGQKIIDDLETLGMSQEALGDHIRHLNDDRDLIWRIGDDIREHEEQEGGLII
jgi:hypothetical protein